eukprot:CAMPEP_0168437680 /NCGR_PEP_ID=MMETSP0228-20121227/41564_1 /TAXON_ID=133427 /ORGANISM="Protoceratium reticulatum, Strain CCCM 535 (=CCMP 1889)" /LENGTH=30 /DNA_ID= /DNA_START= /DNA_END= /DNA_ORIENTATION=
MSWRSMGLLWLILPGARNLANSAPGRGTGS